MSSDVKCPRRRVFYAGLVVIVVVAGLASRAYPEFVPSVLGKYPGDSLWAIMAFLIVGLIWAQWSTLRVSVCSLAFCFAIETVKLYPSELLASIRHTVLGHLVLGHSFTWQNYIAYTIGITIAAWLEFLVGMINSEQSVKSARRD